MNKAKHLKSQNVNLNFRCFFYVTESKKRNHFEKWRIVSDIIVFFNKNKVAREESASKKREGV